MRRFGPMALLGALVFGGCVAVEADSGAAGEDTTGARLLMDYSGDTDVVGFHFVFRRTACDADDVFDPFSVEFNVDLADSIFPGMVEDVEQNPTDDEARHLGAEMTVLLDAGCYDVEAHPAKFIDGDDWEPSDECSAAATPDDEPIEVLDGETVQVPPLVSQCANP